MTLSVEYLWNRFCALRFLIVGGWNAAFGYGVFSALYYLLGGCWVGDVFVQIAAAVLAITNSFICHRIFTYRSHGVWWREYFRVYVVYGGQTLLQMALFFLFATHWGFNGYIVELTTMVLMTLASYWAHKYYSFRAALKGRTA